MASYSCIFGFAAARSSQSTNENLLVPFPNPSTLSYDKMTSFRILIIGGPRGNSTLHRCIASAPRPLGTCGPINLFGGLRGNRTHLTGAPVSQSRPIIKHTMWNRTTDPFTPKRPCNTLSRRLVCFMVDLAGIKPVLELLCSHKLLLSTGSESVRMRLVTAFQIW